MHPGLPQGADSQPDTADLLRAVNWRTENDAWEQHRDLLESQYPDWEFRPTQT